MSLDEGPPPFRYRHPEHERRSRWAGPPSETIEAWTITGMLLGWILALVGAFAYGPALSPTFLFLAFVGGGPLAFVLCWLVDIVWPEDAGEED